MPDAASLAQCVAAEAIRATLSRYCRYVDAGDSQNLSALFHAQAQYLPIVGRDMYRGPAGVRQFFVDLQGEFIALLNAGGPKPPRLKHHLAMPDIQELKTSSARIETRFSVYSNIGLDHTGYYIDQMSSDDVGNWLFDYREIKLDWINTDSAINALLKN
ncbi:nuclear transport factor 2 family protein [Zhongshania marina]|jgi:hypothetical protein|uniref:SnoaL-like domain-containing protein n=1 Tax=Zhongshania marina TaxID=2304603 RepID=A0A2S4HD16_9GAMM|nr:nuclear transport factor 2 family protein [Marortus luteolus]POP51884.1 hypothetical protein C0068_14720 [Marortus luteolus]